MQVGLLHRRAVYAEGDELRGPCLAFDGQIDHFFGDELDLSPLFLGAFSVQRHTKRVVEYPVFRTKSARIARLAFLEWHGNSLPEQPRSIEQLQIVCNFID